MKPRKYTKCANMPTGEYIKISDRLQDSGAKMAAGESSQRHPYIREACVGGEGDDSDMRISVKRG